MITLPLFEASFLRVAEDWNNLKFNPPPPPPPGPPGNLGHYGVVEIIKNAWALFEFYLSRTGLYLTGRGPS